MADQGAPLTPEERTQAEGMMRKVAKGGDDKDQLERDGKISQAKWKIQIWIKSSRSIRKPLSFSLSIWESGKRLHGGGDESAFICRKKPSAPKPKMPFGVAQHKAIFKKEPTNMGCDSVIPGEQAVHGYAICPGCGIRWDTEHIADSLFYQIPVERAADQIALWFRKLDHSADIYVKYRDDDIRTKMMAAQYGVRRARQLKGLTIYPLVKIIRDTTGGATLESLFKALLLA